MTHSMADAGKRMMAAMAAVMTACILVMGCATPAYAKQDPGWGEETYTGQDQNAQSTDTNNSQGAGNGQGTGTDEDSTGSDSGNRDGSDSGNDGNGNDNGGNNDATAESGFTTPGNGNLGDQIKNSNGKDFFTVHTKNNNTFYLVIDHANSSENVYMLSLIDEDDLAEFLEDTQKKDEKTTAPVVIPQTKTQSEPEGNEKKDAVQQPEQAPFQNTFIWILGAAAIGLGALYYFKVYKPGQEEEEDDSEGMESAGDGFETESEE